MVESAEIIDYTYSDFVQGIDSIARQIKESEFKPKYIVAIARGGAVPGVYLSHKLGIPVQMIHWSTRDLNDWANETNAWIPEDIHDGCRVVVVDDIVDGGITIQELLDDWQKSTAGVGSLPLQNIRIAAMFYNTAQDVNVDFYHCAIDRNTDKRWVHFPWEV
jgi:xanthine phosphoribosyltransferase